jgi:beta-ribofuranosylaminobenzene 5'-phosphate synthase
MGNAGYRVNGGIGFALNQPSLDISCTLSDSSGIQIEDRRAFPLESAQTQQLATLLSGFLKSNGISAGASFTINGTVPTHGGFGSSTAIRLACLEALSLLFDMELSRDELVLASGRGGTSGIGINTYFDGGFVFDIGHPANGSEFAPSSAKSGHSPSVALTQLPMPNWEIGICFPKNIRLKTQLEEQHFFRSHCPLAIPDVHEILYHSVYGVTAAVKEQDFERFCEAIRTLQNTAWKKGERALHGEPLQQIEDAIYDAGALAVGMSSLGPGLFFFGKNLSATISALQTKRPDCEWLLTSPRNSGREVAHG